MKRRDYIFWIAAFVLISFCSIEPVKATMYLSTDMKGFARVTTAPGALAFRGKVIDMKDVSRGKEYTFEVIDVLRGDIKDKTVKLAFVGPQKSSGPVQVIRDISLPAIYPGYEVVLFVSSIGDGYYAIIGGEGQGLFYVKDQNGKSTLYNKMGNLNIIQTDSNDPVMKNAILQMRKENTGAIDYQNFKTLFNEAK